jgi:hypothetical protein
MPTDAMRRFFFLLAVVVSAGCKSPPPNDPALAAPGVSKHKCPLLPHGCPGGPDEDGCPDPLYQVGDACTVTAKTVQDLASTAEEMNNEKDLSRLRIVAPTMECANIFRAHLEQNGVADHRISMAVADNTSAVSFQVDAWKEVDCRTGTSVKPPVYEK